MDKGGTKVKKTIYIDEDLWSEFKMVVAKLKTNIGDRLEELIKMDVLKHLTDTERG
jgi:hypothetical protein